MVAASPIRVGGCASRHSRNCQVYYRTVSIRLPQEDYNFVKSIRGASWIQGSDSQLWKRCAASVPNSRRENLNTGWPKPMSGHGIKSPLIHPSRHPTRLVYGPSEQHQKFISRPNRPKHARVCSFGAWLVAPNAFIRSALVGSVGSRGDCETRFACSLLRKFPEHCSTGCRKKPRGQAWIGFNRIHVFVTGRQRSPELMRSRCDSFFTSLTVQDSILMM